MTRSPGGSDPAAAHPAAGRQPVAGPAPDVAPTSAAGAPTPDAPDDLDAAAAALARARRAARERGLVPGAPVRRRRTAADLAQRTARPDDRRDPALLGEQLDRLLRERDWRVDVAAGSVMGRWAEIVGPEIAGHCAPVSFEAGVLVVRAESTAWATQLRWLAPSISARLEQEVGAGVVQQLRVVGPGAPSWRRGPRSSPDGRGPRDTYG